MHWMEDWRLLTPLALLGFDPEGFDVTAYRGCTSLSLYIRVDVFDQPHRLIVNALGGFQSTPDVILASRYILATEPSGELGTKLGKVDKPQRSQQLLLDLMPRLTRDQDGLMFKSLSLF